MTPIQAAPTARAPRTVAFRTQVTASSCSFTQKLKCAAEGAGLIIGPCDPVGMPEDLPVCLPAAAAYLESCEDCVKATVAPVICKAAALAEAHGIHVPQAITQFCATSVATMHAAYAA